MSKEHAAALSSKADDAFMGQDAPAAAHVREFHALADLLPEVVWTADAQGRMTFVSACWSSITSVKPWLDQQQDQWVRVVHPEDLASLRTIWAQARVGGTSFDTRLRLRGDVQDTAWRWFATHGTAERGADGAVLGWIGTVVEITNLKRAEDQAAQAAARLQLMVSQVPLILMTTDIHGIYTFAIGKGLAALGVTSDAIVGHSVLERQKDSPQSHAAIKRVLAGEEVTWEHVSYERCWETHGVPVRDADGQLAGMASISFDITERKDADKLATSEQVARDAAQLKSHFLATMSHEIRTPLGGILGIAQMLDESPVDAQVRGLIDMLQTSGQSLLRIVDEILDYSKLEAGRVTLHTRPFPLRQFLQTQLDRVAAMMQGKGLTLRLDVEPMCSDMWLGDVQHIGVILNHFLTNAVKFTQQGEIVLRCGEWRAEASYADNTGASAAANDGLGLRFEVSDTGVGIDPAIQASLFQPFTQADLSHSRQYGGAGLGLSICRGLADLMRGQITFQSALGQGSTVQLSLPLATASSGDGRKAIAAHTVRRTGRILVADDSVVSQTVVRAALEKLGHDVCAVGSGQAAIDALRQESYDLVMLDCQMPGLDGYEAAARIRAAAQPIADGHERLPILAVTASSSAQDKARCQAAGINGFLTKPFDEAQLKEALAPWFRP